MKNKVQVFLFRINKEGIEYLMLKTVKNRHNNDSFWQPVTGSCEKYDITLLDSASREMKEETGVLMEDVLDILEDIYSFEFKNKFGEIKETVFAFEVGNNQSIDINSNIYTEHSEYKWCDKDNAISIMKWDSNKKALNILNKIIIDKLKKSN